MANRYLISFQIDEETLERVISNLYKQTKMFPKQEESILKKIKEISYHVENPSKRVEDLIASVSEKLKELEIEKSERVRNSGKIRICNSAAVDRISRQVKRANEEKQREVEKELDINRIYFQRVINLIKRMYNELGDNPNDEQKLAWIYRHVYNIPFSYNYGQYRQNGILNSELAKENYINNNEEVKIGIFDKQNLLLSKDKTGVCSAMSGLLEDLCAFACLDKAYCSTITGRHLGEGHRWNYVVNERGLYYIDASAPWNGDGSFDMQFMATPDELRNVLAGYREYHDPEYEYVPPRRITFTRGTIANMPPTLRMNHKEAAPRIRIYTEDEIVDENMHKK